MQTWKEKLLPQLCEPFRGALQNLDDGVAGEVREIRVRAGRPLSVIAQGEVFLNLRGACARERALIPRANDCQNLLETLCGHSLYAHEEEMRAGFLTLEGGFRVGLTGHAVAQGGEISRLHHIGGFNIRVAREVPGAAAKLARHLVRDGRARSALILSQPGLGKTTMLRDAVKYLSDNGFAVALADERGEVAASHGGVPQLNVGARTDVLDGCPKQLALTMLLRTMSPHVLATDELGSPGEAEAIRAAAVSGVCVLATAHAPGYQEAARHPVLSGLLPYFPLVAVLKERVGHIGSIYEDGVLLGG